MGRKNRSQDKKHKLHHYDEFYKTMAIEKGDFGFSIPLLINVKPKNESQRLALKAIKENDVSFIGGPAGTGKTFLVVSEIVNGLKAERFKKVIISRPTVEAGETMGYLPGTADEKLEPYIRPFKDCFEEIIGEKATKELFDSKVIEIAPFQFMRGRTFKDAFIVYDETQNATPEQFELAMTRIGEGSKCVVTYDEWQIDLHPDDSCVRLINKFENQDYFGFYKFTKSDIVRSEAVKRVLAVLGR